MPNMNFEQDKNNIYYYGNPDLTDEEILNGLGFRYYRNLFDEFGNTFEVWGRKKEQIYELLRSAT